MPLNYIFWTIYIISIVFGAWSFYEPNTAWFRRSGGFLVLWILVGMLGWHVFGPAVR